MAHGVPAVNAVGGNEANQAKIWSLLAAAIAAFLLPGSSDQPRSESKMLEALQIAVRLKSCNLEVVVGRLIGCVVLVIVW